MVRRRVLLGATWRNESFSHALAAFARQNDWCLDLQVHLTGDLPRKWEGDGAVIWLASNSAVECFIGRASCPVVSVCLNTPPVADVQVDFDGAKIGCLAGEYFLGKGYRSFAFCSGAMGPVAQTRYEGFACIVRENGGECDRIIWDFDPSERRSCWEERQAWLGHELSRMRKPLAVLAVDDTFAVEILEACDNVGLSVPDKVAVMGVGNLGICRELLPTPLSSVAVDFAELAYRAGAALKELMNGSAPSCNPVLVRPDGIVERESTGTLATENENVALAVRFMMDNYDRPIGTSEIVRASGLSKSRLFVAFKEELKSSPGAILTRIRLDKAQAMLRDTDFTIRRIALACGFFDSVNLYRCLRRVHGISPRAYRNMVRE